MSKAIGLISYTQKIYEFTIYIDVTMLVILKEDGTLWERRAGGGEWKQLETP